MNHSFSSVRFFYQFRFKTEATTENFGLYGHGIQFALSERQSICYQINVFQFNWGKKSLNQDKKEDSLRVCM